MDEIATLIAYEATSELPLEAATPLGTEDVLLAEAPWQQRTRTMWERDVLEPRMVALVPLPFPSYLQELVGPLDARMCASSMQFRRNQFRAKYADGTGTGAPRKCCLAGLRFNAYGSSGHAGDLS